MHPIYQFFMVRFEHTKNLEYIGNKKPIALRLEMRQAPLFDDRINGIGLCNQILDSENVFHKNYFHIFSCCLAFLLVLMNSSFWTATEY